MSFDRPTVVIAGGTGFIGRRVGLDLARQGYDIIVLSRHPEAHVGRMPFPCTFVSFTDHEIPAISRALSGAEALINLSGVQVTHGSWQDKGEHTVPGSRMAAVQRLGRALAGAGRPPRVYIQASAVGYYGEGNAPVSELDGPGSTRLAKVCDQVEQAARLITRPGMRTVFARLGVVLGNGGAVARLAGMYSRGIGAITTGAVRTAFPWIHWDDVSSALMHLMRTPTLHGPVNLVAPDRATLLDLHRGMEHIHGRQIAPTVPLAALRLLAPKTAALLSENSPVVPVSLTETGFIFRYRQLPEALGSLFAGMQPGDQRLVRQQFVCAPVNKVWDFFSRPQNLEMLTPHWLHFQIDGISTRQMQDGTLIDYSLKLKGLPCHWQSRIENVREGQTFTDSQLRGPYAKWLHRHDFEPLRGGVLVTDDIVYRLPFGRPGNAAALWLVNRDLRHIFDFRAGAVATQFIVSADQSYEGHSFKGQSSKGGHHENSSIPAHGYRQSLGS